MSITASELIALVKVSGVEESAAKLASMGGTVDSVGGKLGGLATGAVLVAGAALVGLGALSVKMAADFQQGLTLLTTSAGESEKNLSMVGAGILKMSVDTATGADKLESAMFTVESSGYHGAAGLKVLQAAAEGAKIENADLDQVTQALTTTMHDWREPANQAIDVMNSFREAASIGNMRMDDFVGAMKNVGPVASLAKIPLTDIEGALSAMSLEGDRGASAGTHLAQSLLNMIAPSTKAQAVLKEIGLTDIEGALSAMSLEGDRGASAGTHLAQSLLNMIAPSTKAQKVLQEIGLTAQQVSDDMQKSLPDTLKEITDDIGKKFPKGSEAYNHALSDMFGGTRGLKAILELTGANLKDFTKDAADLAPIMKQNATNVDGWSQVQGNFNTKLQAAGDAVQVLMIKAGTQLLPIFSKMLDAVTPLIVSFSNWIDKDNVLTNAFNATVSAVQRSINFYQQWKPVIDTTATALTFFFVPALIKSGVEAVISAAKIIYSFVASLILTGAEGWAAAGKLAIFIAQMIVVGTTAVINAAKVTYSFIASLIATGVQAYIAAYAVSGSFVPALGMVGMQALQAAGKLLTGLVPALTATGVAADVALGPIGALIAIVTLAGIAFIAMKHKSDEMNLGVSGAFDTMGNKVQRSTGRIIATADQMKQDVSGSANQMKKNVDQSFSDMARDTNTDTLTLSQNAVQNFKNLNGDLNSQMSTIETDVISYWNGVADYIASHQITGQVTWQSVGGPSSATTSHFAGGTDSAPGGWSWVGERGPELMNIPQGAQIIPNDKIGSAASGSGKQEIHVHVYLDKTRLTREIAPELVNQIRTATGVRF